MAFGNSDEPAGIAVGKRRQQHRIYHAENGCAGADAQGGRRNGDCRKCRFTPQHPDGKMNVFDRVVEPIHFAVESLGQSYTVAFPGRDCSFSRKFIECAWLS